MTEPFKFVVSNDPAKARQAIGTLGVPADYDVSGSGDYMVNDVVRYTDPAPTPTTDLTGLYACVTDHTSGSPKVQPGRWELMSASSWAGLSGKPAGGVVDLRDWDGIRNGQWRSSLGATYTSGQTHLQNTVTPFTAADIGKVVIVNNAHPGVDEFTRWMATIVDVSGGVAELDTPAPSSATNERVYWGFDITDALNAALLELASGLHVPREAYLPGTYRATQVVIPSLVTLRGSGWGVYSASGAGDWVPGQASLLKQLPGSECDFVVFNELTSSGGQYWVGPVGLTDITLDGPENNVTGHTPTVGNGLALRNPAGNDLVAQDGCMFTRIQAIRFPENGFLANAGAVPLTFADCRAFYNGKYGIDYNATYVSNTQMLHLLNYSADGNTLGMARFRNAGPYGPIAVTAAKSEAAPDSLKLITPTGADYQMKGLIFEDCDQTPVVINGLSHIYAGATKGPGPAITVRSATTKRPRIAFDAVAVRVTGGESGSIADAVTLRDEISSTDVARTVVSGIYPATNEAVHGIVSAAGDVRIGKSANLELWDTVDHTTNWEKLLARWNSHVFEIGTRFAGTGTDGRPLQVGVAGSDGLILARKMQFARNPPFYSLLWGLTGLPGSAFDLGDSGFNGSSGRQTVLNLSPAVNQSGTAEYVVLLINPTETAVGSGVHYLALMQVGGVDKFTVDHSGNVAAAGGMTAGGGFDVVTKSVVSLTTTATAAAIDGREYFYQLGSGAVLTLPTAVANKSIYHLKNVHTAPISVAVTSSQTIDGETGPLTILPKESYTLVSDNANWVVF